MKYKNHLESHKPQKTVWYIIFQQRTEFKCIHIYIHTQSLIVKFLDQIVFSVFT